MRATPVVKFRDLHSTVFDKLAEPDPDDPVDSDTVDSSSCGDGLSWLDIPCKVPEGVSRDQLDIGVDINLEAPILLDILSDTPVVVRSSKGKEKAVEAKDQDRKGKQKVLSVDEVNWSLHFADGR